MSVVFFGILFLDIFLKLNDHQVPYRYFTKSSLIILLGIYYYFNKNTGTTRYKNIVTYTALALFLIADIVFIHSDIEALYLLGIGIFLIAKLFYAIRFSNYNDFKMLRLVPFFIFCCSYIVFIILLVYDNLDIFFVPTFIYIFACLIVALFAYMRYGVIDKKSFYFVIIGILCAIVSDTFAVLQSFYDENLPYNKSGVMFFYALSQFLIVVGITKERIISRNYFTH